MISAGNAFDPGPEKASKTPIISRFAESEGGK
jgi:hypothetical protein